MTARHLLLIVLALVAVACGGDDTGSSAGSEALAADVGCLACHTETSTNIAPTLHGLWGTEVDLADGRTVTVDEEYVRRSITDPGADIVDGYGPTMPAFPLEDSEVDELVEWVRSLG